MELDVLELLLLELLLELLELLELLLELLDPPPAPEPPQLATIQASVTSITKRRNDIVSPLLQPRPAHGATFDTLDIRDDCACGVARPNLGSARIVASRPAGNTAMS